MDVRANQLGYWNTTGAVKTFGHPVEPTWLDRIDRRARILDYGCGYGRVSGLLAERGFVTVEGVDPAPNLIARARELRPDLTFAVLDDPPRLRHDDDSVDAVFLFAVLTCVPADSGQRELVAELRRVLRPGGLLYVSDLCLQDDQRNQDRYDRFAAKYGTHGIFETGDGAVCRHHTLDWLHTLFSGFGVVAGREVHVDTMNGHSATATQLLMSTVSQPVRALDETFGRLARPSGGHRNSRRARRSPPNPTVLVDPGTFSSGAGACLPPAGTGPCHDLPRTDATALATAVEYVTR